MGREPLLGRELMQLYNQTLEQKVKIGDYIQLTKPRIVVLLAITGMVAYLLPEAGSVSLMDMIIYLVLGYFAAGGAMTINNAIDYDIDQIMERTKSRVSTGRLSRLHVTIFGSILLITGVTTAFLYFGKYTAMYLAWGGLFYIFAYSMYLKRNSWLNTIVGGLASPAPVWGGYAARYEIANIPTTEFFLGIPMEAWILGLLVFIWTPTHTFAMVAKNYDDYKQANIPMLPVLLGLKKASYIVLFGGLLTIMYAITYVVVFRPQVLGLILLLSLGFTYYLIRFVRDPTVEEGTRNFHAHNIWLGLVFVMIIFGG